MQPYPIIDLHSHVLPEMDDGSQSLQMSAAMLREMGRQGVDFCAATPHFFGYRESVEAFLSRRERALEKLAAVRTEAMPKLLPGAEAAVWSGMKTLPEPERLCIAGSHVLLAELPAAPWTETEVDVLSCLCLDRGLTLVLAHIERALPLQRDRDILKAIFGLPLYAQMNTEGLLHPGQRRACLKLLAEGRAQLLGSDCHDMRRRRPTLAEGRGVVRKRLGEEFLMQSDRLASRLLGLEMTGPAGGESL